MTKIPNISPDEHSKEEDNKSICNELNCQDDATELLDLPFEEGGSTLFFLLIECKKMIENMENS